MSKTDDRKLPSTTKIGRHRRLFSYIEAYWRGWLLLGAVTIVSIPFALLQPWPMQVLVGHVLNGKPVTSSALAHLIAVLPGAGSAHGLLAWVVAAGLLIFVLMSRVVSDSWCMNAVADNLLLKPVHVVFTLVSMAVVMAAMDLQ